MKMDLTVENALIKSWLMMDCLNAKNGYFMQSIY